jgi:hypothetical protein
MAFKLSAPIEKRIELNLPTDVDPDQDTYVVVAQATQREVERRAELFAVASRIFRDGAKEVEVKQRWSAYEQHRLEVYLCLADTNILDADGKPMFTFRKEGGRSRLAMSEEQFKVAWGKLPSVVADAIVEAVLEVNPDWNPNVAGE